jgi:hypothetical protein
MEKRPLLAVFVVGLALTIAGPSSALGAPNKNADTKADKAEDKADEAEDRAADKAKKKSGRSDQSPSLTTRGDTSSSPGNSKKHKKLSLKPANGHAKGHDRDSTRAPRDQKAQKHEPSTAPVHTTSPSIATLNQPTYATEQAKESVETHVKSEVTHETTKKPSGIGAVAGEIVDLVTDAPPAAAFPFVLILVAALFLLLQGRLDRSDPKIVNATKKRSFVNFE